MVVVTPLLTMLLGFAFWFYQMHQAQMAVYRDVREPTWQTATFSCGDPGETSGSFPRGSANVSRSGGLFIPTNWFNVYRNAPGPNVEVITRSFGEASKDATRHVDGATVGKVFEVKDTQYRAQATMMCNEKVEDGQLDMHKRIAHILVDP